VVLEMAAHAACLYPMSCHRLGCNALKWF